VAATFLIHTEEVRLFAVIFQGSADRGFPGLKEGTAGKVIISNSTQASFAYEPRLSGTWKRF
jgi:hypothetical protein